MSAVVPSSAGIRSGLRQLCMRKGYMCDSTNETLERMRNFERARAINPLAGREELKLIRCLHTYL